MSIEEKDYIKLLSNLEDYMEQDIVYVREGFNPVLKRNYPICRLKDIELKFNHAKSLEEACENWNRRKVRINYSNLFVMMFTKSEELAHTFSTLRFEKKICFVPFRTDIECCQFLNLSEEDNLQFFQMVNMTANRKFPFLNFVDLLAEGKIKTVSSVN